mmetsp:Transcript_54728/g.152737  ORF Transcript_54728/g.152737 Transcript_54728/m.152737 type:complete len:262 (-) Transcript_54728:200-985(-)
MAALVATLSSPIHCKSAQWKRPNAASQAPAFSQAIAVALTVAASTPGPSWNSRSASSQDRPTAHARAAALYVFVSGLGRFEPRDISANSARATSQRNPRWHATIVALHVATSALTPPASRRPNSSSAEHHRPALLQAAIAALVALLSSAMESRCTMRTRPMAFSHWRTFTQAAMVALYAMMSILSPPASSLSARAHDFADAALVIARLYATALAWSLCWTSPFASRSPARQRRPAVHSATSARREPEPFSIGDGPMASPSP